ncbi:cytochrome c peroxidase [Rhodovulum iodosum]|uniref:Cytochrome c peroxidase n=1 Tax=Rhodovulum iodosum TaxID=68291 RepID=A0ABV3XSK8_9RHOB|nr:cytochrome c peroxidase [Rhodovulum robiginosum]RSK31360.1 cytochrome-c peroxidase [Rhodovulum robiginosum]
MIRAACLLILFALPAHGDLPLPGNAPFFPAQNPEQVRLGRLLFYDPILSGSRQVSCASCHHPAFGTSDALSLGLGDGARGLGPDRRPDPENMPEQRIPRNSQALFNLGAAEFTHLFHDGRLEVDPARPSGLRTPLEDEMVQGFSGALSAQNMFPVLSPDEMAGHYGESDVSVAVRRGMLTGEGGAWDIVAKRVAAIPAYRAAFDRVIGAETPIRFTDISNALAAFIAWEWRADDSPFDRYLRKGTPLPEDAAAGMALFYGKAGCADCHSGRFQTDHDFHAIAMPQIGPGKVERFESHQRDVGRMRVTGRAEDAYRFRTPSLRNVTATPPYGHAGAYDTLMAVIRHHLDPVASLSAYERAQAVLPPLPGAAPDFTVMDTPEDLAAIAAANELALQELSDSEIAQLIAFLGSLTDRASLAGRLGVPDEVPSGLPVERPEN